MQLHSWRAAIDSGEGNFSVSGRAGLKRDVIVRVAPDAPDKGTSNGHVNPPSRRSIKFHCASRELLNVLVNYCKETLARQELSND